MLNAFNAIDDLITAQPLLALAVAAFAIVAAAPIWSAVERHQERVQRDDKLA